MTDLLGSVLDAHGGLDRWQRAASLQANLSLGGPFWASKGWPDVYADQRVTLDTRSLRIAFEPFPSPGRRSEFTGAPERLDIVDGDGDVLESRHNPRATFPPTEAGQRWDAIQTSYFTSCAVWNYLTEPFVFTYAGVTTEEITPWTEDGERWRRLAVTFPANLPNHNPDQVFYYGDDFMLRRMDYQPEVTGILVAQYTYEPRTFDGLVFPTKRRVHRRDETGRANKEYTAITVDIDSIHTGGGR
ncbi:MAG: hypothetical protein QOD88_783 [Mycobacterium sp.]|jgi:hypothetical protein|nr:hypothetical protein [Mycobacterium sp.]